MPERVDEARELADGLSLQDRTDSSLLRRLRRGDGDAATTLYVRYARRLLALTRAESSSEVRRQVEAEDIVQSVFLSFFRKAAHGMYDVPEGEELWNLLLVITINKIRAKGNYFRAARRDVRRNVPGEFPEFEPAMSDSDEAALGELQLVIGELLAALPPKSAEIVEMRIAGHMVAEIARATRRSLRTVERTLQDFRKRLSDQLSEEA